MQQLKRYIQNNIKKETENKCEILDIDYKFYKREKSRGARVIKERIFNQVLRNK